MQTQRTTPQYTYHHYVILYNIYTYFFSDTIKCGEWINNIVLICKMLHSIKQIKGMWLQTVIRMDMSSQKFTFSRFVTYRYIYVSCVDTRDDFCNIYEQWKQNTRKLTVKTSRKLHNLMSHLLRNIQFPDTHDNDNNQWSMSA